MKKIDITFHRSFKNKFLFLKFFTNIISKKKKFLKIFRKLFNYKIILDLVIFIKKNYRDAITSDLLADLIIFRLKQKNKIKGVIGPILKLLRKKFLQNKIKGYAILLTGRFSRKDRASYDWKKIGKTTRNNRMDLIDYSSRRIPLKYSTVAFKISLIRSITRKNV